MRYYIPTTTLNFNNILSSESVSPSVFFEKRGFGYSRWFEIPENNMRYTILLYDKLSNVERMDSELEDHPMIIEITTDESFQEVGNGIYMSDKTIYLNPWNTKFIFLSEQDKRIALSLSDSSLETKMIRLYQRGFEVRYADGSYPLIDKISGDLNNSEINHDKVVNKLKGLLYGYYIGALLSSNESTVQYYNVLKELQNIFAAILSSPHREPTTEQSKKVMSLVDTLLFHTPIFKEIEAIAGDREKAIEIANVLTKYGKSLYNSNPSWFLRELRYGDLEDNKAIKWVSNELSNINSITNKNLLSPDKGEIIVLDNALNSVKDNVISDKTENDLFIALVNHILTDDFINGKVSSHRAELTDILTMQARDLLGNQWEASPIRTFMNQLRKHVRGDEFNQEWNNGVLSSLAAVILKGDDWEVLLDFMKRKGMTDYRLAFAFYGVFNGFANLTRDFTDLLLNNDSFYVADVYKEIHGSLHGERIVIKDNILAASTPKEVSINVKPHKIIAERPFNEQVLGYFYSKVKKSKRNQTELENELKRALEVIGNDTNGYLLVCVLNDYPTWKRQKKAWQEMQHKFCPDYEKIIHSKEERRNEKSNTQKGILGSIKESLGGIFAHMQNEDDKEKEDYTSIKMGVLRDEASIVSLRHIGELETRINFSFQNIDLLTNIIKELNPQLDDFALKQISKDLNWVLDPKYSNGKSEADLLEIFRDKLISGKNDSKSKYGKDMKWKNDAYRYLDIERTIQAIKNNLVK